MEWCKLYARLPGDPAILAVGERAAWLFVVGLCYCAQEESDGFIPAAQLARFGLPGATARAEALVRHRLWTPVEGGWRVTRWADRQSTKDRLAAEREQAAERQRRKRNRERGRNGVSHGVTDGVTSAVTDGVSTSVSDAVSHGDKSRGEKTGGGSLGGVTNPREGAREGTNTPPPNTPDQGKRPRCIAHRTLPYDQDPGPCQGCKQARERAERYEREAVGAARDAIRACDLCDAEGRRLGYTDGPIAPRCDHKPTPQQAKPERPSRGPRAEYARVRAEANTEPCDDPEYGCGQPTGETCVDADGAELAWHIPAHHTRIAAARKVPA